MTTYDKNIKKHAGRSEGSGFNKPSQQGQSNVGSRKEEGMSGSSFKNREQQKQNLQGSGTSSKSGQKLGKEELVRDEWKDDL